MKSLTLILIVLSVGGALSLTCIPCGRYECPEVGDCPYSVGRDICGCCERCLKGPGEDCAGPWNTRGKCGDGLTCEIESVGENNPRFYHVANQRSGTCVYAEEATGEAEIIRTKRNLDRRRGKKLISAKTHKHLASSGIPDHILKALRAKGYTV